MEFYSTPTSEGLSNRTSRPAFCPYCGSSEHLRESGAWQAHSHDDPDNVAEVEEHQCMNPETGCEGRSFWS